MKTDSFTPEVKQYLLKLARTSISSALDNQSTTPRYEDELMSEILACFVTLHSSNGMLRGCIGNIIGFEELELNVINNAKNAAFQDPRFPAVSTHEELNSLHLEISVLTRPAQVPSYTDITIGKHGIILKNGRSSAVFLPQVAPEQGWDLETTLTHLSMKAGLSPADWRDSDTTFEVFEAVVFSEDK